MAAIVMLAPGVLLFGFGVLFPHGPASFIERLGMLVMPTVVIVGSAVYLWRERHRPEVWPGGFTTAGMTFGVIIGVLIVFRSDLLESSPITGLVVVAVAAVVVTVLLSIGGRAAKRVATGSNQNAGAD